MDRAEMLRMVGEFKEKFAEFAAELEGTNVADAARMINLHLNAQDVEELYCRDVAAFQALYERMMSQMSYCIDELRRRRPEREQGH